MTSRRLPVLYGCENFSLLESELEQGEGFVNVGGHMLGETFDVDPPEDVLFDIVVSILFRGIQVKGENFLLLLMTIEVKKVGYLVIVNLEVGYLQLTIL